MRGATRGRLDGSKVLAELEGEDWSDLGTGYRDAPATLASLRRLAGMADPSLRRDHVLGEEVFQDLVHQGTVSPVTARAMPFVVGLAEGAQRPLREHLLSLVAACAHPETRFVGTELVDAAPDDPVRSAVDQLAERLVHLGDADPGVRRWIAVILAAASGQRDFALAALGRWSAEADPADDDRVAFGLALVVLGAANPAIEAVVERWAMDNPDAELDLAEVIAHRTESWVGDCMWHVVAELESNRREPPDPTTGGRRWWRRR